ncbi:TasA family protein [Nocardioides sp. MAHUQ-72]|uniref:TasA family protein n=1 Tax=unclassified Nocardioides TaxID=2615069 RepID=UPI00360F4B3D
MRTSSHKTAVKILASVVLVGGAASVAGLGTFGSFSDTTAADQSVATGKVDLGLTQHASAGTTVAAVDLVPGDTVQRSVTLTRSSDTEKFGSVLLTTTAGTQNVLATDATNGLQLRVDQCSVAWVKNADGSLTCGGTTTGIVASRAVVGSALDLGAATTTMNSSAAASNLRLTLTLPTSAGNTFQGLANTITFTFDATQRTAEYR